MEEWKDIEGYEGKYMVSNLGNVKSLSYNKTGKEKIMKPVKNNRGYLHVILCKEGKVKAYTVHRLVATAFIPNTENLPEVNHIDEDKNNNSVENLEWVSSKYNINYGTRNKKAGEKLRGRKHSEEHNRKIAEKLSKPIYGINKVNGLIVEFPSTQEAERITGIDHSSIAKCCKGKLKSAGGFYWMYADQEGED